MCDVHQPVDMNQHEMSIGSNALSEREEASFHKVVEKKRTVTPFKIFIGLTLFAILALVSYNLYTMTYSGAANTKIVENQGKYIQGASSSSGQDSGSQSGSQSNRNSKDSNRPLGVSKPMDKGSITGSSTGNGDDGEEPSSEDNDGEKRKEILKTNKGSDGSSTEENSDDDDEGEDDDEDVSGEAMGQGMVWPNNGGNTMPLVGH